MMGINNIALVLSLLLCVSCIDQQCTANSQCPAQSSCINSYCVCLPGYIGNCSTPAQILTSDLAPAQLIANQTTLFSINPEQLNHYISFTFTICQNNSQLPVFLTIWEDNGEITSFNSGDAMAPSMQLTLGSGCTKLVTTNVITFGKQPNGQNDLLILGITDNGISTGIEIGVTQRKVIGLYLYQYIIISLAAIFVVGIIIAAVVILMKRRALNANSPTVFAQIVSPFHNIEHFQNCMPSFPASELGEERPSCPICLQQIEAAEVVRRTPCNHIFHSSCLDSWCLKSLSCPVCRSDLSFSNLDEPRRSRVTELIANPDRYQTNWQQQPQISSRPQSTPNQISNNINEAML